MTILIALDDGHGMETPGKRTPYVGELKRVVHENEFNRAVVKFLDAELKRCGFATLLVAPTDVDTSLEARTDLANAKKADAYVSIHYDALDAKFDGAGKDPEGHTVFVYTGQKSKESGKLASTILKYLNQGTPQQNRGVKEANLHVLRETHMIAILSENGFMDNKREALLMVQPSFQKEVAIEHAKGLCEYFGKKYVPEPVPVKKPVNKVLFKVQVGAFSNKPNADKLDKELEGKGFTAIVVKEGNLFKVQCGAFSVRKNADELAKKITAKGYKPFVVQD